MFTPLETKIFPKKICGYDKKCDLGFTIVETMIFLTVSLMVFGAVVAGISRQNRDTAFAQSVRDVEIQLQDIFNDVENGFYPSTNNFKCEAPPLNIAPGTNQQGTNEDCIFIGKAIQFGQRDAGGNRLNDRLAVYTIVGKRLDGGQEVTAIQDADPTLLEKEELANQKDIRYINSEVEMTGLHYNDPGLSQWIRFSGLAVMSGFAEQSGATLESGIVRTSVAPIGLTLFGGQGIGSSDSAFLSYITSLNESSIFSIESGTVLCLQEKGGGHKAEVNIAVDGQRLATNSTVRPATGVCA